MEKEKPLQRICTSCGLTKPLSAFLYISSTRGTTYGALCSACRGAEKLRKQTNKTEEDAGSTTLKLRIGAEEKIHIEKEWERRFKEKTQSALEEKKKKEKSQAVKTEDTELEEREKRILPPSEKPTVTDKRPPSAPGPARPERAVDAGIAATPEKKKEWIHEQEKKEQKITAASAYVDSQQTGTVARHISDVHRGFMEFLGESSAAASQIIKERRAKAQQLFSTGKNTLQTPSQLGDPSQQLFTTANPENKAAAASSTATTPSAEEAKAPEAKSGFQRKK